MNDFFSTMSGLERAFTLCAILGGVLLLVRIGLMMVGGDVDTDADADLSHDVPGDTDGDFRLISVQGVMAFLLIFGLSGRAFLLGSSVGPVGSFIGAMVCGVLAMWAMGMMFVGMRRLQASGNVKLQDAVGCEGTVYLTIPEGGSGQVQVVFSGKMQVHDARTEDERELTTGTPIVVTNVVGERTLVVENATREQNI